MTGRERFLRTIRYERPDRVPYFEEGLRDDVLERWHAQGLPAKADLARTFHTDRREQVPVDLEPVPRMMRWPTSRRGLKALRERMNPEDPARYPKDWAKRVKAWHKRQHILELRLHRGFFISMGARTWPRFLEAMYLLSDAPDFVKEMLDIYSDFGARLADRVLREVKVDWVSFSEPIGGNEGPLLSPRQYEEFVLPGYRAIIDVVKAYGVPAICLVTYANARVLLPGIMKSGFNCLWACEVNTRAMDYRAIRREFGRALRLIGGIDLDALSLGKAAIRKELLAKATPLLKQGGYIPLADGRVRANVPLANYVYYRRVLEQLTRS